MPTSPTSAARGEPTNGAAEEISPTVRAQPAQDRLPRPGKKRARQESEGEDLTGVIVKIGGATQQRIMARLRSAPSLQTGASGSKAAPGPFRPAPDEAMEDVPVAVQEGGDAVVGREVRVMDTQGCGGRGLGRLSTEQREPNTGRESSRRDSTRTRRGPKRTSHQRRFAASRPTGYHAQLNPWDLTPLDIRSTAAGQERSIFRTRGLLVSHFDFQMYRMLYTFNVGLIPTVFPTAPQWWPSDWGSLPITLPWEVSLNRSLLVSADPGDPVWKDVYQKFLEQLAGGWDLHYNQTQNKSTLIVLPSGISKAMIDAGAFAFCAGRFPSQSFRKFCELHSFVPEELPDQRGVKNSAWQKINALRKERKEEDERKGSVTGAHGCHCQERIVRAARRLGLEAQTLEVASEGTPLNVTENVEQLCSLASAAMTYSIQSAQLFERVEKKLDVGRRDVYSRELEDAQAMIRGVASLAEFLPRRFASNLSRVGPGS